MYKEGEWGRGVAKGLRNGYLGSPSLRTLLAANGGKGTANVLIKVKLGILSGNPQSPIPLPLPCTISANNNSGSYSQQSTRNWQLAAGFSLSQMLRIRSVKLCPCLRHKHTHTNTHTLAHALMSAHAKGAAGLTTMRAVTQHSPKVESFKHNYGRSVFEFPQLEGPPKCFSSFPAEYVCSL